MHYLIKKKNKKRIDFKSIFLKVSYIAKNVIYIKKFSIPTKEQKKNHKSILLTYPGEINVNFQVERYKVKLIKSDDPLLENAQKLRYKTFLNSFRFQRKKKIDNDKYDNFCDHLVVIDTFVSDNFIVGTYRLLMNNGLNESSDLYTETCFDRQNYTKCFLDRDIPKLDEDLKNMCEQRITEAECYEVLKSFKNNKTPGNDGLSKEWYMCFWTLIKMNFSFSNAKSLITRVNDDR